MTTHILCAVDLSQGKAEIAVLQQAADLAKFHGAALSVVTVLPDYGMTIVGSYFKDGTMKDALASADRQLHDFVKEVLGDQIPVQHIVEIGSIYEKIISTAGDIHADLVVLGAHKPDLMDRIQGPNSSRVARYCGCSVYIVREGAAT